MTKTIRVLLSLFLLTVFPASAGAISTAGPALTAFDTLGTTAALGAADNTASVGLNGQNGAGMFLAAGTLIGTLTPEISYDGGTTWVPSRFYDPNTLTTASTLVFASSNPATMRSILTSGGASTARVRVSSYTSGTANATLRATRNEVPGGGVGIAGATFGSASPSEGLMAGVMSGPTTGGLAARVISCDNHVFKNITTATDTLAVQGVASQTIYVCAWRSRAQGTATWYLENTASTNANCASTLTQITGLASEVVNGGEVFAPGFWNGLKNTSGNGLCINSTGTGGVNIDIFYTQF